MLDWFKTTGTQGVKSTAEPGTKQGLQIQSGFWMMSTRMVRVPNIVPYIKNRNQSNLTIGRLAYQRGQKAEIRDACVYAMSG